MFLDRQPLFYISTQTKTVSLLLPRQLLFLQLFTVNGFFLLLPRQQLIFISHQTTAIFISHQKMTIFLYPFRQRLFSYVPRGNCCFSFLTTEWKLLFPLLFFCLSSDTDCVLFHYTQQLFFVYPPDNSYFCFPAYNDCFYLSPETTLFSIEILRESVSHQTQLFSLSIMLFFISH